RLKAAGADRYLLRHETADAAHYAALHPATMALDTRLQCLRDLRELGFQVGCGFMVGSPGQTPETLAQDLKFIETFQPDMCGIGPFIPHAATPFADQPAGSVALTCYLLSVIRLICPQVLLPATTALGTLAEDGREQGLRAGANVVMPNLSPTDVRGKYELYNNKLSTGAESAEALEQLKLRVAAAGYTVVTARGDRKR
ncbi:MAG: [Clostridia bacterium]|nr:[FeFe] hydrogenase H-cluster radical SAM maturase HydE [Clostridia bacterium]